MIFFSVFCLLVCIYFPFTLRAYFILFICLSIWWLTLLHALICIRNPHLISNSNSDNCIHILHWSHIHTKSTTMDHSTIQTVNIVYHVMLISLFSFSSLFNNYFSKCVCIIFFKLFVQIFMFRRFFTHAHWIYFSVII